MIGIVLVSHSARLAEGVAELAAQVAGASVHIAVAGGLDLPGSPLGTDAALVARAIDEAWSEDGVLVLMDLGSAVLSAEMALELLPDERRERVLLTAAPLVEGAVAAAVAAGLGRPLAEVAEEARAGLAAKLAQLADGGDGAGDADGPASAEEPADADVAGRADARTDATEPAAEAAGPPAELRVTVRNRLGLHARPAAALVRTAAAFDATVSVTDVSAGRGPADARSLNAVATLGVRCGDEIVVRATGPDAAAAVAAVRELAGGGFGEPDDLVVPGRGDSREAVGAGAAAVRPRRGDATTDAGAGLPPGTTLQGLPASPGIAVGPARHLHGLPVAVPDVAAREAPEEWAALQHALAAADAEIRAARALVAGRAAERDAAILDAQELFLTDEALVRPARERIFTGHATAARAWAGAVSAAAAAWEALEDPYQRARVADLRAAGDQVLRILVGAPAAEAPDAPGIVVAPDLTPVQTAAFDPTVVLGIACARGGPTSHAAILARSLGIPAVVGLGDAFVGIAEGRQLALDGESGDVTLDPPDAAVRTAERRRAEWRRAEADAAAEAHASAVTRDGVVVPVEANIAGAGDAGAAAAAGADGVGLLRTEFLFLDAERLPDEDEQTAAYLAAATALGGLPLTVRTLDAGADKQLPFLPLAAEQNPFLGLRGLRLGLDRPQLLLTQLRALLRAAADHPLQVMFPMVTTVDEVRRAGGLLDEARASLADDGVAVPDRMRIGIMVEVPAAALAAETFAPHVDFFSLGTNDLAQYTLAAERGNAAVAGLADPLHPAVLRLIAETAAAGAALGRPVTVCGEVAGDPLAVPLLLGLGVTGLSMAPARIPRAKQAVRAAGLADCRALAAEALRAESAATVRRLLPTGHD